VQLQESLLVEALFLWLSSLGSAAFVAVAVIKPKLYKHQLSTMQFRPKAHTATTPTKVKFSQGTNYLRIPHLLSCQKATIKYTKSIRKLLIKLTSNNIRYMLDMLVGTSSNLLPQQHHRIPLHRTRRPTLGSLN
jgi:hypothetical protein